MLRTRTLHKAIAGALVLLVAGLALTVLFLRPDPFERTTVIRVRFDDATGISLVQRDVRIAGVLIGDIGAVRRVGDDAEVELVLREDVGTIHRDATAVLRPHTPFEGTAYIDLDPGTPGTPALGSSVVPSRQTKVYVPLDEATRVADAPNRRSIGRLTAEAASATSGRAPDDARKITQSAPGLLRSTRSAAQALRGTRPGVVRRTIRDLSTTIDVAVGDGRRVERLTTKAAATAGALATDGGAPLARGIDLAPRALRAVPGASREADRLFQAAVDVTRAAQPALGRLDGTLRSSEPALRLATDELPAAADLLQRADVAAKTIIGARDSLSSTTLAVGRAVSLVQSQLIPTFLAPGPYGLPMYMQLLAGFSAVTGLTSTLQVKGQNPQGYGHALRGGFDLFAPRPAPIKRLPR